MNLATEIFGDVIVVHAPDELSEDHSESLVAYLTSLVRNNVVLDVDSTEMIDSKGLESLLMTQRTLREEGGEIKISTTNSVNRKILEITRLDEELEIFDSVIDAVKSFA